MKVLANATPTALWYQVIQEAEGLCGTHLQQEIEAYLVIMLQRYMDRPEIVKQIMATDFMAGLKLPAAQSQLLLQNVGDVCLLFSGLFPGLAEKRLVKISYFIALGRAAYSSISRSEADVYGKLNDQFVAAMDVLQSTRQYSREYPDLLPLQAYELWNESGSQRALAVLKRYAKGLPVFSSEADDPGIIRFR